MQVTIDKGNLIISIPLEEPRLSSTGKSKVIAASGGFMSTQAVYKGEPVKVNLTATIPK